MKLTREQQLELFEDYHYQRASIRFLADKYGVSHVAILKFIKTKRKQIESIQQYINILNQKGKKKCRRRLKS